MPLTPEEREQGRAWRAECQALLAAENAARPPGLLCSAWSPPFLRHDCTGPGGTRAMPLREQSITRGRFRFTWLEGRCHRCGTTARSSHGYIKILEESSA